MEKGKDTKNNSEREKRKNGSGGNNRCSAHPLSQGTMSKFSDGILRVDYMALARVRLHLQGPI